MMTRLAISLEGPSAWPLSLPALAVLGVVALPAALAAQEWTVDGTVSQRIEYQDNIGLNALKIGDANSSTLGRVNLGLQSPTAFLNLGAELDVVRFFKETDLNSNDSFFNLDSGAQVGAHRFGFGAEAVFDTTRTSGIDDLGAGILANKPRQTFSATPTWQYQWSATDVVGVFLNARLERFPNESGGINNDTYSSSLTYGKQLTAATAFDSALTYGYYDSEFTRTHGISLVGGVSTNISPRWRGNLVVGPRFSRTEDKFNEETTNNIGVTLSADTTFDLSQLSSVTASAEHGLVPSSSGEAQNFTAVRGVYRHQLVRGVYFDAVASFDMRERIESDDSEDSREYADISPRIRWEFVEDWELTGLYRFRWNSPARSDETFTSNTFFVGVTYRTPRWFVWR